MNDSVHDDGWPAPSPASTVPGGTLGVLGGMGPLATIHLLETIVHMTPATSDQDHVPTVVINDPRIPDRTAAILEAGPSPVPQLRDRARRLERADADLLAMPCNSAHHFLADVRAATSVPVLDMVGATVETVADAGASTVGLLATSGAIDAGLYQDPLGRRDVDVVTPTDEDPIMDAIYAIKRGDLASPAKRAQHVADDLLAAGADIVIIGCTELSIVMEESSVLVDPLRVLADQCVAALADC